MKEEAVANMVFPERHFISHLRHMIGSTVSVSTFGETVRGTLREVFPDHILVELTMGQHAHVRIEAIAFVTTGMV